MKDIDIRESLRQYLGKKLEGVENSVIIEELGLCQGDVRADLVVVNGYMHGYEIKSDRDTLRRLPKQCDIYSKTFDYVTLITSEIHLNKIRSMVPKWWGLSVAEYKKGKVTIHDLRENKINKNVDPSILVQLLWRDETLSILRERNLHRGLTKKPRMILWHKLADNITIKELSSLVRNQLMARQYWRSLE